jgi:ATP-dependent Clp protease, protease subunit
VTDIQKKLLEKRLIHIQGEVNGEMVLYVQNACMWFLANNSPEITVLISSNGGSAECGLMIYDYLSTYPNKVNGVVLDIAKSMAAIILQACTVRRATMHSQIRIHHISRRSVSLDIIRDKKKMAETLKEMEKNQARQYKILSMRTGKDVKTIRNVCKKDEDMNVEEALAFGLIDEIELNRFEKGENKQPASSAMASGIESPHTNPTRPNHRAVRHNGHVSYR